MCLVCILQYLIVLKKHKIDALHFSIFILSILSILLFRSMPNFKFSYDSTPDTSELTQLSAVPAMKRKKTAMCTIVTNEELYLDEFVDYHHALGFDNFFIYDNTEGFEMKQWGNLKGDHVELISFSGPKRQLAAYVDCGSTVAAT